jgi:hypothetical protein
VRMCTACYERRADQLVKKTSGRATS